MFFRNLRIYRFNRSLPWTSAELESHLDQKAFQPCEAADTHRIGWVAPAPAVDDQRLLFQNDGCLLLCLRRQEKILPGSVVRDAVEERAFEIEQREQRTVGRKEKRELRDQLQTELLPRAFSRNQYVFGYIDTEAGLLFVDTTSANRADEFTSALREAAGTLPVQFVALQEAPSARLTAWVAEDQADGNFELGDQCELHTGGSSQTVIRCKGSESLHDAVGAHIEKGMSVEELALEWDESLRLTVTSEFQIKRLKALDRYEDKLDADEEDAAQRFAGAFGLMTLELRRLFDDLVAALGGEDRSGLDAVRSAA